MNFKEKLELYLNDGIEALPSVEILLTKNRYKILSLLESIEKLKKTESYRDDETITLYDDDYDFDINLKCSVSNTIKTYNELINN